MKPLLFAVTLLFLLAGCSSHTADIRVRTEVGSNANLSQYKSYSWLEIVTSLHDPRGKWQARGLDIAGEIKFFIDRELREYGLHYSTTDPDIAVAFQLGANMESLKLAIDPNSRLDVLKNVPDATLTVVLIDTATRDIIWISKAEAEIQQDATPEMVHKRIDYTITEMFKKILD